MTDRRSLQSSAARDSRAFQFVPGHVGGRVASAQPVKRRNGPYVMARPEGGQPNDASVWSSKWDAITTGAIPDITMPSPGAELYGSWLVGIVAARGCAPITSAPSGWSVRASGTVGATDRLHWAVVMAPWTGAQGLSFAYPGLESVSYDIKAACATVYRFTGGSGGEWLVTSGGEYADTSMSTFAQPDPSWSFNLQITLNTGVHTPPSVTGLTTLGGFIAPWYTPPTITAGAAGFEAAFVTRTPTGAGPWDWGGIGVYGAPHSKALAIGWVP